MHDLRGGGDAHERLDPSVEVAVHHVGAADVDLRVSVVVEREDARVLEVAAEDAAHPDILAQTRNPGFRPQIPRTQTSTGTPAWLAR